MLPQQEQDKLELFFTTEVDVLKMFICFGSSASTVASSPPFCIGHLHVHNLYCLAVNIRVRLVMRETSLTCINLNLVAIISALVKIGNQRCAHLYR